MGSSYLRFDKDSPEYQAIVAWWRELDSRRGERAILRRCRNLTEVAFSPSYHHLRLTISRLGSVNDERLALIAAILAHVKADIEGGSIAEQMATGKTDGTTRVSGLRFRRLLKVKEQDELFRAMIRMIALLGSGCNLQSLVQSLYFWNDEMRKRWAFDYYSKSPNEK